MVERILELMKKNKISGNALENTLNLSHGTISNWRTGKNKISSEVIKKIAQYFNVSADYLLCLSDTPTPLKVSDIAERKIADLSTEIVELVQDERFIDCAKMYKALPDEKRDRFYGLVQGIIVGLGLNIQQILGK